MRIGDLSAGQMANQMAQSICAGATSDREPVASLFEDSPPAVSIWKTLSDAYDIHNLTGDQMAELSQTLYDTGEITLRDHASLSFNPPDLAPEQVLLTPPDGEGEVDWIAEYQARIEAAQKNNDTRNLLVNQRIMGYLTRIDTGGAGMDVTA